MDGEQVNYRVTIHNEDDSFWAEVDDLPGCFASGDTLDELWVNLAEAIGIYHSTPTSHVSVKLGGPPHVDLSESVEARVLVH